MFHSVSPLLYVSNRSTRVRNTLMDDLFSFIKQRKYDKFYDCFAGSAAASFFAMQNKIAKSYIINDLWEPLAMLWHYIKEAPETVKNNFEILSQDLYKAYALGNDYSFFNKIQYEFNNKTSSSEKAAMVLLLINYSEDGAPWLENGILQNTFSQNKDILELKDFTKTLIQKTGIMLANNKVSFRAEDFAVSIKEATSDDFVFMDPPYPENLNAYNDNISTKAVYPKIHDKENMHNIILDSIDILSQKKVSYLILYGLYQGSDYTFYLNKNSDTIHLLCLSGSLDLPDGLFLENIYISKNISLTNLPMGLFDSNIFTGMSKKAAIEFAFESMKKNI